MNLNDREPLTRVFHRTYKDAVGNVYTEYKDANGNIYTEYKDIDGNVHVYEGASLEGQLVEEQIQAIRTERADLNTSKGLLIGVIVACVAGLTAGLIYFLTRPNDPQPVSVTNVPTYESTQAPSPEVRVVEQPVLVPVPQAPKVTENTTTQSSASNPSPQSGNTNVANPTNPTESPSAAVPEPQPLVTSPATNPAGANSNRTDSQIKAEILKQFQTNLPNHQLVVEVDNGNVAVSGMAATPEQLQRIQPVLGTIKGVGMVNITATAPSQP